MGFFGKSFDEKVNDALREIEGMGLGASKLGAKIEGKVVTLTGEVPTLDVKKQVMAEFNARVDTDNTLNTIRIIAPTQPIDSAAPTQPVGTVEEAATERWHQVVSGDTLGAISKRYYGKSSQYMKIFEANRDVLDNPDLIKVGQRLRIPE